MRKIVVAGNWKMNLKYDEAKDLVTQISKNQNTDSKILLAVPFVYLQETIELTKSNDSILVGAQNCHHEQKGAYTGEISVDMLSSINADFSLVGHSERRQYFNENSKILKQKVDLLLENDLDVVYCVGESLEQRENNKVFEVIESQLSEVLFHLSSEQMQKVMIAYEPVWAIGTGKTASAQQAQEVHAFIRSLLEKQFGKEIAQKMSILYGGSMKPANAQELLEQNDIDGGLIGGASLKADSFQSLIDIAEKIKN